MLREKRGDARGEEKRGEEPRLEIWKTGHQGGITDHILAPLICIRSFAVIKSILRATVRAAVASIGASCRYAQRCSIISDGLYYEQTERERERGGGGRGGMIFAERDFIGKCFARIPLAVSLSRPLCFDVAKIKAK